MTTPSAIPGSVPPAGWYADPSHPARQRWWDGVRWTDQVRGLGGVTEPVHAPETWPRIPAPDAQLARPVTAAFPGTSGTVRATADGVALASFWRRALATVFDNLLVSFAVGMVLPFFVTDADSRLQNALAELYSTLRAGGTGTPSADLTHLLNIITYSVIATTVVYGVVTLGLWSRTLGQRVVGIAVSPTDKGKDRVSWRHAIPRALVWGLLSQGGGFLVFVNLMSVSFALWHPKRQTIPDLLARTQVVHR